MGEDPQTLPRLLKTKSTLGLSAPQESGPPDHDGSALPEMACINCGYSQQGQRVDRCPECSLPLASRLADPTSWSRSNTTILDWWKTARDVWIWDRRTRMRTSYIPINPKSRRFAKWSVLMTAPCLGTAVAVIDQLSSGPGALAAGYFFVLASVSTILAGFLLASTLFGLTLVLQGTWRRRLQFVPASVDYATAWWPPVAVAALVVSCLQAAKADSAAAGFSFLVLIGAVLWGLWLWGSATESQHVYHVAIRIVVVLLGFCAAGLALLLFAPGQTRKAATQALVIADSGLLRLNVFGTFNASLAPRGPQTYALFIDNVPSDDESLILDRLADLGAGAQTRVVIRGKDCTLAQIDKALNTVRNELKPQDRFILYINGHGSPYGSGSIQMADGEITSQRLKDHLRQLPTTHCLIVLDSCFAGKFLPALRDTCNATVITSTDDRNIGFCSSLTDFWKAMKNADFDGNDDGRVTVNEAFWSVYRDMLAQGEKARSQWLRGHWQCKYHSEMMANSGFATPQLEVVGKADGNDFAVTVPQQTEP
jgi:hypothetical protein